MLQSKALASFVSDELSKAADPVRARGQAAYMKVDQPFCGIAMPGVDAICRRARREFVPSTRTAYERNVLALWRLPYREARYAAVDYAQQQDFVVKESMALYERMIREGAWWDVVDEISSNLVGVVLLNDRRAVRSKLDRWIKDLDMWIRRAALLAQLRHKQETDSELLFRYCLMCSSERDFFIRKAIGWALREYSKTNPEAVKVFLVKSRACFRR